MIAIIPCNIIKINNYSNLVSLCSLLEEKTDISRSSYYVFDYFKLTFWGSGMLKVLFKLKSSSSVSRKKFGFYH